MNVMMIEGTKSGGDSEAMEPTPFDGFWGSGPHSTWSFMEGPRRLCMERKRQKNLAKSEQASKNLNDVS